MAFEFDATGLEGKTLVAFETLTRDGIEVAVHADVDDADQTVELYTPEEGTPGKGYPKTGGPVPVAPIAASIVILSGCAAAGAAYALGTRRKGLAADSGEEPGAEPGNSARTRPTARTGRAFAPAPPTFKEKTMHNAKLLIFPLGGLVLMVAVALVLTWVTATPHERDEMSHWVSEQVGIGEPEDARQIDWASLPPEIVAWVEVPGTEIDEPIVQADPAYPNRWLYADVFGEGRYGTPYIDCDCSLEGSFTIVYGHHMDDGSVFADFASFSDESYAREHQMINLYTRADNQRHELRVAAIDVVNANYETLQTEFEDEGELEWPGFQQGILL